MPTSRVILALTTLILLIAMVIFGLNASMNMDSHGNMVSCPLMNGNASICRMNIVEHLSAWQSLSAAVMPNVISLLLVFTFLLMSISSKIGENDHYAAKNFLRNKNQNFIALLFNPILLALGRGILHTKVYDYPLSIS